MGVINLAYIDEILQSRKRQAAEYDKMLSLRKFHKPIIAEGVEFNHAYYPIVFESHDMMMKVKKALELEEIFPRRYFFPSLSSVNYVEKQTTPISDDISNRILCLPMYFQLSSIEIEMICRKILRVLNN